MELAERFYKAILERDAGKQVKMIDDLSEQDAKDILKAYVQFFGRTNTPNFTPDISK